MKKNDCPECQGIEDEQYTCTTCWGQGGIHMFKQDDEEEADGNYDVADYEEGV